MNSIKNMCVLNFWKKINAQKEIANSFDDEQATNLSEPEIYSNELKDYLSYLAECGELVIGEEEVEK